MRRDTPCAIITNATLAMEKTFQGSLDQVADIRVEGSPKLMIIGEVARLAQIRGCVLAQADSAFERQPSFTHELPLYMQAKRLAN
jgi:siroheme synthase